MDPSVYVLIFAMVVLLIIALIISNTANSRGGTVMPHPIFPHPVMPDPKIGPYWEHDEHSSDSRTGLLY
jgi:hypothetical protein